jgi:hypothetical protein
MTTYIGNAISLGMLDELENMTISRDLHVHAVTQAQASELARGATSCVGHADTALLISSLLGYPVEMRRASTSLVAGDTLVVAQYNGPRLPERATSLPEGAKIRWLVVTVHQSLFGDGIDFARNGEVAF